MAQRILVVDDEKNIRVTIQQCLVEAGYEVELAVSGEHALQKLEAGTYDLVLLDIKLPDLDGIEVLRRLKHRWPEHAVVMITAFGTIETAVQAMKLGAVDYLQKPFTPDEIRNVVKTVLARTRLSEEEAQQSFQAAVEYAKGLISRQRAEEALPHLKRAVALDPDQAEPYNLLGLAAELRGDLTEALKMYRAALAVDPGYRPALANLERATDWRYSPPAVGGAACM
ncbi:MAG TPA: response regulator [Firmicutes bacterium]|nr:response regulator [Bacillota bacterium]